MRKTLYALLLPFVLCACDDKGQDIETQAHRMLQTARGLMVGGCYQEAKDTILSMRKLYPTAFDARATGIIVMDSIELLSTQDSLALMDSVLQVEQALLQDLEAKRRPGRNTDFFRQRTRVFHLKQRFDEMEAKAKFYLRKIEIDKQERDKMNEQAR